MTLHRVSFIFLCGYYTIHCQFLQSRLSNKGRFVRITRKNAAHALLFRKKAVGNFPLLW